MKKQRFSRKVLNICIVMVIVVIIGFIALMLILDYDVNGETNMPFEISKISVISTIDGKDVDNLEQKWDINVIEENDVYISIKKNNDYSKQETIKSIKFENFCLKKHPNIGNIYLYKPSSSETCMYQNIEENIIQGELEYTGDKLENMKELKISNQGGMVGFRCANESIGTYKSNEDKEINYKELLKKLNISQSDINATMQFDMIISLDSGKKFKAEKIQIEIPADDIVESGTVGKEITDKSNIIFKRIEN